jgi:hypothetical protein
MKPRNKCAFESQKWPDCQQISQNRLFKGAEISWFHLVKMSYINVGKENSGNISSLKAYKRAPSLELSKWENGNLTTKLAEKKDTNGAFLWCC